MDIVPEPGWNGLCRELSKHGGTAMVIGATDSGKSSLSRYLVNELLKRHLTVSLVDADIGQSSLGLPGTISMKFFRDAAGMKRFRFQRMMYLGTANPALVMTIVTQAIKRMVGICKTKSEITVLDTDGLIAGEVGKNYKTSMIRALRPDHIIAPERERELEPILKAVGSYRVHRLTVSGAARVRSRTERTIYRQEKMLRYFEKKSLSAFSLNRKGIRVSCPDMASGCPPELFEAGTVIGLNRGMDTKALGLLDNVGPGKIKFLSPVKGIRIINKIVFGDIKLELR